MHVFKKMYSLRVIGCANSLGEIVWPCFNLHRKYSGINGEIPILDESPQMFVNKGEGKECSCLRIPEREAQQ